MKTPIIIALLSILAIGCKKDFPLNPESDDSLKAHLASFGTKRLSTLHHAFFSRTENSLNVSLDQKNTVFITPRMTGEQEVGLYVSDSLSKPDSLGFYKKVQRLDVADYESLLIRLHIKNPHRKRLYRMVVTTPDSFYLSKVLLYDPNARPTKAMDPASVKVTVFTNGRALFEWTPRDNAGVSGTFVKNCFTLAGPDGKGFCGVITSSRQFRFFDLRNVLLNISADFEDPRLVLGAKYQVEIFTINDADQASFYGKFFFVADTNEVVL
ncbi:MAG: hypothetical protein Kow0075_07210 [Salibacteraceae bacterium]